MVHILAYLDEPPLAAGLKAILASQQDTEVHCVESLSALWSAVEVETPDIIILSLTPEVSLQTIRTVVKSTPQSKVILWLRCIDPAIGGESIRAGVRGILRRTLPNELLVRCIQKVSAGELWIEKSLANQLLQSRTHLTAREYDLLNALACGLRNKEIAVLLHLTEASVKIYVSRLLRKLSLKDRFELALYGLKQNGTLPLDQPALLLMGTPPARFDEPKVAYPVSMERARQYRVSKTRSA